MGCEVQPREPVTAPDPKAPVAQDQKLRVGKPRKTPRALPGGCYLVVLEDMLVARGWEDTVAQELTRAHSGQLRRIFRHALRGCSITLSEATAQTLAADPRVRYVEEDAEVRLCAALAGAPWGSISAPCR
ncbi:hypothetical protein F0U59_07745 [Archangium gephyra]|nr:hypothetical protein F0U59_07745 [Archangium gephyra]